MSAVLAPLWADVAADLTGERSRPASHPDAGRPAACRSERGLDRTTPLMGLDLRHALIHLLTTDPVGGSISALLEALAGAGFTVHGAAPKKVVSDALRWEIKKGRVRRTGWGRYAIDQLAGCPVENGGRDARAHTSSK